MMLNLFQAAMPENKSSVSSAEEELVEKDSEAQDRPHVQTRLLWVAVAMLTALLVAALCVGVFAYFVFARSNLGSAALLSQKQPLYASFVLDMRGLRNCEASLGQDSVGPCRSSRRLLTRSPQAGALAFPLGPMACWDDAHDELGDSDNCKGNPFVLAENSTRVVLPLTAVFRVYARVTFDDAVDHYVNAIIRVVPTTCLSDPGCSSGRQETRDAVSHTWLSCFNHNRPPAQRKIGVKEPSQFATCTLDGVRHFSKGDQVSLQVTQEFRSVNAYRKLTHMLIHKL